MRSHVAGIGDRMYLLSDLILETDECDELNVTESKGGPKLDEFLIEWTLAGGVGFELWIIYLNI